MGLKKQIKLENGINLNYHRITSLNKITNQTMVIEVTSYIDEEARKTEEKAIAEGQKSGEAIPINIYTSTIFLNKEYKEDENIKDIYEYLKTLEQFKGAKDC